MGLQEEIDVRRAEIRTDDLAMSIGELLSVYERREIDIHPEFQRFFRWEESQKTKLIESLLLGIPIPPIYVAQRADGVWDVVDGLQRLSTIYEFAGILRDEQDNAVAPLVLEGTKYLPSLEGKCWDDSEHPERSFTGAQRLYIKRTKIDVSIILRESDERSKFELFQRLNTGGSSLSNQELRNCILVATNRDMFSWMRQLSQEECFTGCVNLTDRALEEQYDMELVLRFLVFRRIPESDLKSFRDLDDFLTDKMVEMAESPEYDRDEERRAFLRTFETLQSTTGSDSFRRYDASKGKFAGGFLVPAFEAVALGIGYNHDKLRLKTINVEQRVHDLWEQPAMGRRSTSGVRASTRIPQVIPLGREIFRP